MKFKIDVSGEDREYLFSCFSEIFSTSSWSEGKYVEMFEEIFGKYVGAQMVATSTWSGAAMAVLEYIGVKDSVVLVPSNTFMAAPLAAIRAGAQVEFVDCNRNDLCMSAEDLKTKIEMFSPKVVMLVHIGGHIAFEINEIVELCEKNGIVLIEDCAHAHGAEFNGRKAGMFGLAGMYSFYATKTMTTGEGGCVVSNDKDLIAFVRKYINYGKFEYEIQGLNYRMNEFNAAIGAWQAKKLPEIIEWKNKKAKSYDSEYKSHLCLPEGMTSGFYKYIVFEPIKNSTGKVYDQPCHRIMKRDCKLPNTDWVAENHWCVPLFYKGDV
jgi:perosamine synthetase